MNKHRQEIEHIHRFNREIDQFLTEGERHEWREGMEDKCLPSRVYDVRFDVLTKAGQIIFDKIRMVLFG